MGRNQLRLREEAVAWQEIDDEIVVLDLQSSEYFKVNGTGALLWQRLSQGAPREDLVDALGERYELPPDTAERDVDAFLAMLRARDLVEPDS